MKTNSPITESSKKVYESPSIEKIRIDNEVSLVMATGPPAAPTPAGPGWTTP